MGDTALRAQRNFCEDKYVLDTPYQAVFSDIDGTLLNRHHQISTRTRHSIQRILALGVPFILVSA